MCSRRVIYKVRYELLFIGLSMLLLLGIGLLPKSSPTSPVALETTAATIAPTPAPLKLLNRSD